MADIDIERKGTPVWPWILGLLLLALLLWAIFAWASDDAEVVEPDPAAAIREPVVTDVPPPTPVGPADGAAAAVPLPVTEYVTTCTPPLPADMEMGRQHQFTAQCLESLAASLESVVGRDRLANTDVSQKIATVRQQAQTLRQSEPQATTHAGTTKQAFTAAADMIEATYQAGYREVAGLGDEVSQVRNAAQAVDTGTPMLDQKGAVHGFFREAADAVQRIAETPVARG